MKNSTSQKIVKPFFIFFFAIFLIQACVNKEKNESVNSKEIDDNIDFSLLARFNESNIKTLEITNLILNQTEVKFPSQLILKIKKDHSKIKNELKRLTEKNYMITQKPIYSLDINEEAIKNDTTGLYTLRTLKTSIQHGILALQKIEKAFPKGDFQMFATQTIPILKENKEDLSKLEKKQNEFL